MSTEEISIERLEGNKIRVTRKRKNGDDFITIVYVVSSEDVIFLDGIKEKIKHDEEIISSKSLQVA